MPIPPPTDWAPPLLSWSSWGQFYFVMLLFLILVILLVQKFFPHEPGKRPGTLAMLIIIIAIIFVIVLTLAFAFVPFFV